MKTDMDALVSMLKKTVTPYQLRPQKFPRGYTPGGVKTNVKETYRVLDLNPGCRDSFWFVFDENGDLLSSESAGY